MPCHLNVSNDELKIAFGFHVFRTSRGLRVAAANRARESRKAGKYHTLWGDGLLSRKERAVVQEYWTTKGWFKIHVLLPARASWYTVAHEMVHFAQGIIRETMIRKPVKWRRLGKEDRESLIDELEAITTENGMRFWKVWKDAGWKYTPKMATLAVHPDIQHFVDRYAEAKKGAK